MSYLILVRHGQSEWNLLGKWTGLTDVSLTEEGRKEAKEVGKLLKERSIHVDHAFTSELIRTQQTLDEILKVLDQHPLITHSDKLNEKNYGVYTGKNKWEVQKEVGDQEFLKIRRSWDYVLPNGESLKNVYERAVPYYQQTILPLLEQGENILVVSHGNTLRAIIKYLDNIKDENISHFELVTGEVHLYTIAKDGKVNKEEVLTEHNTTKK